MESAAAIHYSLWLHRDSSACEVSCLYVLNISQTLENRLSCCLMPVVSSVWESQHCKGQHCSCGRLKVRSHHATPAVLATSEITSHFKIIRNYQGNYLIGSQTVIFPKLFGNFSHARWKFGWQGTFGSYLDKFRLSIEYLVMEYLGLKSAM